MLGKREIVRPRYRSDRYRHSREQAQEEPPRVRQTEGEATATRPCVAAICGGFGRRPDPREVGNGHNATIDAVNAFARRSSKYSSGYGGAHRVERTETGRLSSMCACTALAVRSILGASMGATDDDSETPGWAAVPSPPGTVREVVRLVRRLPVRFDTLNPLSYLGSTAVTKTVTRTETRAATGEVLPEFFRTHEAAAILRLSVRTLDSYRSRGGGPAYFVFGNHVAYARTDLAKWAAARRSWTTAHADAI